MENYDQTLVNNLMQDGLDHSQAVLIASAEMEGVAVNEDGTVHGLQTYCNILGYSENTNPSRGAKEGEEKCTREVQEWLEANGFKSLEDYYSSLEC